MKTRISLVCLASISAISCISLVGCADDSIAKKQATNVQATFEKPVTLASDEIDLLAECQGEAEFTVDIDSGDESDRFFLDAYRQAAAHVPKEERQRYEQSVKAARANLAAVERDLLQSIDAAERRTFRSELFGAEAEKRWARCDDLIVTRFPKIHAEMIAKARALGFNP